MTDYEIHQAAEPTLAANELSHSASPFPPLSPTRATVMSRLEVEQCWPEFAAVQASLRSHAEKLGCSPHMLGTMGQRNVLGGVQHPEADVGKALVLILPSVFVPCLAHLAEQCPHLNANEALDKQEMRSILCWECTLPDGRSFRVETPAYVIDQYGLLNGTNETEVFVPVVFAAGDSIAWGGFRFSEQDEFELCSTINICINYRPHRDCSEEELEIAAQQAELAGSNRPWALQPWQSENGVYRMELPLFAMLDEVAAVSAA